MGVERGRSPFAFHRVTTEFRKIKFQDFEKYIFRKKEK
jgi:hypothetical protein